MPSINVQSATFEELALPLLVSLYNQACWLARNRTEAEDIVQETYLRIAKYPMSVAIEHPKGFLLKVARNVIYDAAQRTRGVTLVSSSDETFDEDRRSVQPDQLHALQFKDVVLSLPEDYRKIFTMSRLGGMEYREIAEVCGLSEKAVERRMARAMAIVAKQMSDQG